MKINIVACPLLLVLVFMLPGCHKTQKVEKDVQNYYPKVKTVSAAKQPDGTVIVTGQIISQGNNAIQFAGFCMDTLPNPSMMTNQVLVTVLNGDQFSYTYSSFNAVKKYYFRAWAANGNGYAIGSDVYADSITFDTSTIPCHPQSENMTLTGSQGNANENYIYEDPMEGPSGGIYSFHAITGNHEIDISFGQIPIAGIYSIVNASYPNATSATVSVDGIISNHAAAKLYVRQIDAHHIEITICSVDVYAKFGFDQYSCMLTTKFRASIN